jgi:hypothetical protein
MLVFFVVLMSGAFAVGAFAVGAEKGSPGFGVLAALGLCGLGAITAVALIRKG